MIAKKRTTVFIVVMLIALSIATIYHFTNIYLIDVERVPGKSQKGKVVLTSRGCCFFAKDVTVYLIDENGNKIVLIAEESVYELDIFECENIPKIESPVKIGIDFMSVYSDTKFVSLIVWEFFDTDEMLKKGLLLRFGDGDLRVRHGNSEKFFIDGVFGVNGSEWYQEK